MHKTPGRRVRDLRLAAKLSMAKLAQRVAPPTSASQINKLEKGVVEITRPWAERLAGGLGVHWLDILEPDAKLSTNQRALVDLYSDLSEDDQRFYFELLMRWRNQKIAK